jgi:UDP-N-acetylmuramoylalanine--D-glutamate ligase
MPPNLLRDAPSLAGRRVTVMGLGLFGGGSGVARWLVAQGARVTVTDQKPEAQLRESVEELAGLPVAFRLGGHDERDFREADLVVFSPAVPPSHPLLALAPAVDTEMNLFFKLCRARTCIGITGSNGKTTTTTLVGEILRRHPRRSWVGGNIGVSLLDRLDDIDADDLVVLELSSFQLEQLGALRRSPSIAVVTNLSPNHLDRHGTMDAYADAKRQILAHQRVGDFMVLNADDGRVRAFASASPAELLLFSDRSLVDPGVSVVPGGLELRDGGLPCFIDLARRRALPGRTNEQNMAAAAAAVYAVDRGAWEGWRSACEEVFREFPGVEHRLEFVAERGGVKYYNDSKATDAEATLAALETLPGPFLLILGGFDKKTPWDGLARGVAERPVRAVALYGQTAPALEAALRAAPRVPEIHRVATLEEALRVPARSGETVLFSPACASWDQFRNYVDRGRLFKALVAALPGV